MSPHHPKGTEGDQLSQKQGDSFLSNVTLCRRWSGKEGRRTQSQQQRGDLGKFLIFLVCPEPPRDDFCSQEESIGSPRAGSQCQEAAGAAGTGDLPLETLPEPSRNSPCWRWDREFHQDPSTTRIWAAHKIPSLSNLQPGRDSHWDNIRDLSCRDWELQSCLSIPIRFSGSLQSRKHLSVWSNSLHYYYSAWVRFKCSYGELHCFLLIVLSSW